MSYTPTNWKKGDIITSARLNNIEDGVSEVSNEYTPTNWQNGDVITADKLNNIEQGIVDVGGELAEKDAIIQEQTETIEQQNGTITEQEKTISEQVSEISELESSNATLTEQLNDLRSQAIFRSDRYFFVFNNSDSDIWCIDAHNYRPSGFDHDFVLVSSSKIYKGKNTSFLLLYQGTLSASITISGINHTFTTHNCTINNEYTDYIMDTACTKLLITFTNPNQNATIVVTA